MILLLAGCLGVLGDGSWPVPRTTAGWHRSPRRHKHQALPTFPLADEEPHLSFSIQNTLSITETVPDHENPAEVRLSHPE